MKTPSVRHIHYILIKYFRSLSWKVLSLNCLMHIWNEQRSVQFITFVIYLCLFRYDSECESVEIKQIPVIMSRYVQSSGLPAVEKYP